MATELTGLLVADSSRARLYSFHKASFLHKHSPKTLTLLDTFDYKDSRSKISDLVSDKLGDFNGSTFNENATPKQHAAQAFAHALAKKLEMSLIEHHFRDVILVAPPHFMGLLHPLLAKQAQHINQCIEKDYTPLNERELIEHLLQHF